MRTRSLGICLMLCVGCVTEEPVTGPTTDTSGSADSTDIGTVSDSGVDADSEETTDAGAGSADTSVEDTAADTAMEDTAADTADVESCLLACGVGCPAPEFQICGADGELYCNSCYMNCYGVQPAADPSLCSPCGVYDSATAVDYRLWSEPSSCFMSFDSGTSFAVATTEAELRAMLPCMDPAEPVTGVDWAAEQVVRVVQSYNPSLTVQGVFAVADGTVVATRSPVYCGGAAPPTSAAFVIVASGRAGIRQESCIDGICEGGPFP